MRQWITHNKVDAAFVLCAVLFVAWVFWQVYK